MNMIVKFKKLDSKAVTPSKSHPSDAGLDLTATSIKVTDDYIEYGTSLAFEIPEGFVGLIFPRSSVSNKALTLSNSVGVIDSGYHGEIKFRFKEIDQMQYWEETKVYNVYNLGDRIGQLILMPFPKVELEEVDELPNSDRGSNGYGSSGK